jgi:hypothetical protein
MVKEYKVVKYKENIIKAVLFGQAKVSPRGFTKFLNRHSREGWSAISIDKSVDSVFLLFSRENYVIVLEKERTTPFPEKKTLFGSKPPKEEEPQENAKTTAPTQKEDQSIVESEL